MEKFIEDLTKFNYPTVRASKTKCFSCKTTKILPEVPMNEFVREIEDFHSSPKPGAKYYACIHCMYLTKKFVKYKKMLQPSWQTAAMRINAIDSLLSKNKKKRQKRKQKSSTQFSTSKTYKIDQIPELPQAFVRLERLNLDGYPNVQIPVHQSKRSKRIIKRKLSADFDYSTDNEPEMTTPVKSPKRGKRTKKSQDNHQMDPNNLRTPIVLLQRLNLSDIDDESSNEEEQTAAFEYINENVDLDSQLNRLSIASPLPEEPFEPSDTQQEHELDSESELIISDPSEGDEVFHEASEPPQDLMPELNWSTGSSGTAKKQRKSVSFNETIEVLEYVDQLTLEDVDVDVDEDEPESDQANQLLSSFLNGDEVLEA